MGRKSNTYLNAAIMEARSMSGHNNFDKRGLSEIVGFEVLVKEHDFNMR